MIYPVLAHWNIDLGTAMWFVGLQACELCFADKTQGTMHFASLPYMLAPGAQTYHFKGFDAVGQALPSCTSDPVELVAGTTTRAIVSLQQTLINQYREPDQLIRNKLEQVLCLIYTRECNSL